MFKELGEDLEGVAAVAAKYRPASIEMLGFVLLQQELAQSWERNIDCLKRDLGSGDLKLVTIFLEAILKRGRDTITGFKEVKEAFGKIVQEINEMTANTMKDVKYLCGVQVEQLEFIDIRSGSMLQ